MKSQSFFLAHAHDIVGIIAILFFLIHVFATPFYEKSRGSFSENHYEYRPLELTKKKTKGKLPSEQNAFLLLRPPKSSYKSIFASIELNSFYHYD